MNKGLLALWIVIMFFACFFSNLWGRASQRMEIENVDVVRIHTNFRETNHYSYCPYCGKELKDADSN